LLSEVAGNAGTLPPAQIVSDVPKLNAGITLALTVTVNVVPFAHWFGLGVNVYMPEFWLSTVEGFHVPVTPLSDGL
jgi:hypothetical protein